MWAATRIKRVYSNCSGEHPANSNLCPPLKIEKKFVMKVLLERCTPQEA